MAQGFQPYVAYHGGQLDQVNMLNGGLTVRIPLASYPQKGSSLSLSYSVIFNSFGFESLNQCEAPPHQDCTSFVKLTPTALLEDPPPSPRFIMDQQLQGGGTSAQNPNYPFNISGRFFITTADNAEHPLGLAADGYYRSIDAAGYRFSPSSPPGYSSENLGHPENAYSGDTAMLMSVAPGTIVDSKGNTYTTTTISDPDNNTISISTGGFPVIDSTGRTISAPVSTSISQCPSLAQAQNQPLTSALLWQPPGSGAGYIFCYASVSIHTHLLPVDDASNLEYVQTESMLQSIVLPNNTFWGFVYDSSNGSTAALGQLMTLIYPTGGQISYTYGVSDGFCNQFRSFRLTGWVTAFPITVMTRIMQDAQGNALGTWSYSYPSTNDGVNGTILSPEGDLTVTKFTGDNSYVSGCSAINAGQDEYQGNPATSMYPYSLVIPSSAIPLRSTTVSYLFPPNDGVPGLPVSTARENQRTTVLNGTSTSSVQKSYAQGVSLSALQCDPQGENCTGGNGPTTPIGGPVSTVYTDYSGAILKQESVTYQWQSNPSYLAANLLDIPASTSVLDGSGTTRSQTTYTYDEPLYSPGGVRGHATTTTEWLNTGAAPTSHTGWNVRGEKAYTIDADGHRNANGHTTDYLYNACNGSLVTDTYNALNQHISGTYDCNTGFLTSYTDANGNTTQYTPDTMRRITLVNYPDGGSTSFNYADAQDTVTRTVAATPDPAQTTTVSFDGFGREIHRYTSDSPQQDIIDTTYDSDGRLYSVTNPYRTTSDSTYGLTTYSYDALNRKTVLSESDGTSQLTWSYSGNITTSTDEVGNSWARTNDALGRLSNVVEPGGLYTAYSYDPLGNLLTVNQLGLSDETPRTRSFTYDSLSRLLISTNPETGTICYGTWSGSNCVNGYDPNGNLIAKTDARGNTIYYSYENLNRLLSKTYTDGFTLPVTYAYDTSPIPGASNTVGRMTNETVFNGNTVISQRSPYIYDTMGRVEGLQECTPANCSASPYQLTYSYDVAGNPNSSTNGIPSNPFNGATVPSVSFNMQYDQVGRLNLLTSNWASDGNHPPTLFQTPATNATAPAYDAAGQLQNAMLGVNSQSSQVVDNLVRTYDSRLRVTSETDSATTLLQQPATVSNGSILIAGSEAGITGPATPGTGTITITGSEGQTRVCTRHAGNPPVTTCTEQPDTGALIVTIDGFSATAIYESGSTDATVAAYLATALNASGSPVTASSSGGVVTITSLATGPSGDYSYSITNGADFSGSGSDILTGGANGSVTYDAGTISVSAGTVMANASWQAGSTAQTIASAIASALTASGSFTATTNTAPSGVNINVSSTQAGIAGNVGLSCTASDTANQTASFSATCNGMNGGSNAGYMTVPAYSYTITPAGGASGYAPNGNLLSYTDSVMGTWSFGTSGYDSLNRLVGGSATSGPYQGLQMSWSYDSFGNRTSENFGGSSGASLPASTTPQYNANNQVTGGSLGYDPAGNVTADNANQYLYDGEGRICAVYQIPIAGVGGLMTGYLYDAEGARVAKGTISSWSCDSSLNSNGVPNNGFMLTNTYVIGPSGEQLTEIDGNGNWLHTNVFAAGQLLATYSYTDSSQTTTDTYFALNDWLGTKRAVVSAGGCGAGYVSLPYGDSLTASNLPGFTQCPDVTEHHFTGKERDTESGNDYFGARYYASNMGRFMSPDWSAKEEPVPYAKLDNPQSLNLYAYVGNNPLGRTDADGHAPDGPGGHDDQAKVDADDIDEVIAAEDSHAGFVNAASIARAAQQQTTYQSGNREANVVYHETSALQPVDGKSDSGDLHDARVGAAHVYNNLNDKSKFQDTGTLNSGEQKAIAGGYGPAVRAYKDSLSAVSEAASGPDTTNGSKHFFVRDVTAGDAQHVPSWANGNQIVYGPFRTTAGGDGPIQKGDTVYIWINNTK